MMDKEMTSELYCVPPDEINDSDVFVAEVKIDNGQRKITLRKWEED
jgi:hypothetical protein